MVTLKEKKIIFCSPLVLNINYIAQNTAGTKQISNKWIKAAPLHAVNDFETTGHRSDLTEWNDLEKAGNDLDLGLNKMAPYLSKR